MNFGGFHFGGGIKINDVKTKRNQPQLNLIKAMKAGTDSLSNSLIWYEK